MCVEVSYIVHYDMVVVMTGTVCHVMGFETDES
jgi:hypothetical protein